MAPTAAPTAVPTAAPTAAPTEAPTEAFGEPLAQVIWTEENKTLTFLYAPEYREGELFKGKTVTRIFKGDEVLKTEDDGPGPGWAGFEVEKAVIDRSFQRVRPTCLHNWFNSYKGSRIEGMEYLDTSEAVSMSGMFNGAVNLTELDVSHFNTSKVTDMAAMFTGCLALESLVVTNIDPSKVTNMWEMFRDCMTLRSLNVSGFNTSNVGSMAGMFSGLSSITSLDVSSFNTSKVQTMDRMFLCPLTRLDLSSFDMSGKPSTFNMLPGTLSTVFCFDSDSDWQLGESDVALFCGGQGIVGRYGDREVSVDQDDSTSGHDKSAKLGGYFTPKYMSIRFDANGGEGSMKEQRAESFFYREAGTALQPNAFTRDGFRFIGWNTKEDGTGSSMEDSSMIAPKEDLTLYAQWEKID